MKIMMGEEILKDAQTKPLEVQQQLRITKHERPTPKIPIKLNQ
jgi:hypothetical protein